MGKIWISLCRLSHLGSELTFCFEDLENKEHFLAHTQKNKSHFHVILMPLLKFLISQIKIGLCVKQICNGWEKIPFLKLHQMQKKKGEVICTQGKGALEFFQKEDAAQLKSAISPQSPSSSKPNPRIYLPEMAAFRFTPDQASCHFISFRK